MNTAKPADMNVSTDTLPYPRKKAPEFIHGDELR
jgi:hypothetical protein